MKQTQRFSSMPWPGALLALAAMLTLAACDSDVNVTGPRFPEVPRIDTPDSIWVAGTLATADGYCYEARLLYDGREIDHGFCRAGGDCSEMKLAGFAPEGGGRHTVELQVLRQEPPGSALVYRASAELKGGLFDTARLDQGSTSKVLRCDCLHWKTRNPAADRITAGRGLRPNPETRAAG